MSIFTNIEQCLESTERAKETIKKTTVLKYQWNSKEKRDIINYWIRDLFSLIKKDPMSIPKREPLLFVLADKIILEDKSFLFNFLRDLKKYQTDPLLETWKASKEEEKK